MDVYINTNRTTQEKIHWRCSLRSCRSPLQSNIFSNDQDVRVLSVGTHNHNTASYTKNDFKEIKHEHQVASKSSEREKRVCEINDDHDNDFFHEKIGAEPYDCIVSARNCSSSDIETAKICRCDKTSDYDKINLYKSNTFNKYMKCMKEIEPSFLSSVLKGVEPKIDICSILNEKEDESIETQKIGPALPIVTATSKKIKQVRDETSHIEKCIQKFISWKNKIK